MVRHPPTDTSIRDHKLLGTALRELRTQAGLTQEQLGARAGIGASYLSQLENGHRGVSWHTVIRLLEGIGVDLHQLADARTAAEKPQRASKPR
jgi:transcriptional regulator with XRE-family HTH domain